MPTSRPDSNGWARIRSFDFHATYLSRLVLGYDLFELASQFSSSVGNSHQWLGCERIWNTTLASRRLVSLENVTYQSKGFYGSELPSLLLGEGQSHNSGTKA